MNDDTFDVFPAATMGSNLLPDLSIQGAQVRQVRDAFAAAGIDSMAERRAIIESCTVRPVASIRELLAKDLQLVLRRIQQRGLPPKQVSGSAWDDRDEDTWIDKL